MIQTRAPSAVGARVQTARAKIEPLRTTGDAAIIVKHRELISEIDGAATFTAVPFALNPGIADTFPWLTGIANLYEFYQFRKLCVEFVPMKGADKDGLISLAIDFDASDDAPTTLEEVGQYHLQVSDRIWNPLQMQVSPILMKEFGPRKYTRSTSVANTDIKTYDLGNLYVSVTGCADTSVIGLLYLDFEVELRTPQVIPVVQAPLGEPKSIQWWNQDGISTSNLLGSNPETYGTLDVGLSGTTFTFAHSGAYFLSAWFQTSGGSGSWTVGSHTNIDVSDLLGPIYQSNNVIWVGLDLKVNVDSSTLTLTPSLSGTPELVSITIAPLEAWGSNPKKMKPIQHPCIKNEDQVVRYRSLTEAASALGLPVSRR